MNLAHAYILIHLLTLIIVHMHVYTFLPQLMSILHFRKISNQPSLVCNLNCQKRSIGHWRIQHTNKHMYVHTNNMRQATNDWQMSHMYVLVALESKRKWNTNEALQGHLEAYEGTWRITILFEGGEWTETLTKPLNKQGNVKE